MVRLGVDLGERRVGLAVCDALEIVASPLETIRVRAIPDALAAVLRVADEYAAEEIVVGWPLHMNGRRGEKAQEAEAFVEQLRAAGRAAVLWDERLTTAEAERGLRAQSFNRRQRRERIDAHAARVLLAGYLEYLARQPRPDFPDAP